MFVRVTNRSCIPDIVLCVYHSMGAIFIAFFLAQYRKVQVFIFHPAEHYQHYLEHYMAFCGALLRALYPILPSIIRQHLINKQYAQRQVAHRACKAVLLTA